MKKTLMLILLAAILCFGVSTAEEAGMLGQPFPDFTAVDTEGNTFVLSEALKDHEAVVLNLWATWCTFCKTEFPFLSEAREAYGDRVAFIALSAEEEDTMEKVAAYRREYGVDIPMGLDEGAALYAYTGGNGFPTTVIIDRFGNAAFEQIGAFLSAGDVKRAIGFFLGDGYTETVVLREIPPDTATGAFPVSSATAVRVENEGARYVTFFLAEDPDPLKACVVEDDTARLRLEAAAADNPSAMICFDAGTYTFHEVRGLLDPQRGVYTYQTAMPGADAEQHFTYVILLDGPSGAVYDQFFLISGDEYIGEMADWIASQGYTVTWEYTDSEPEKATTSPAAYLLYVVDQDGAPVPGVYANFCTDSTCVPRKADENGVITFDGAPDVYHVQLLKVPEGYSFDEGFEMYTGDTYGEWILRIRKD